MAASERVLGVGVIGLGGASLAMIPKFVQNPNFRVIAAADIDTEIRKDFPDAESYDDAARLCASRSVDSRLHCDAEPVPRRTRDGIGLDVSAGGAPGRPGAA